MSVEAMPSLTPDEAPASQKRPRRKKKEGASNVIPLASFEEQMEDVEANGHDAESEGEAPRHSGIFVFERSHTSEVEREHEERTSDTIISLHRERDEWKRELDQLEGKNNPSEKERERCDVLRSRIKRVSLMEDRAKEVEIKEKTEERMKEVERDLETARKRLQEVERERKLMEEDRAKRAEDIRNDRKRIDALNEELKKNPTDDKKAEVAKISQHLEEARSEMEGRDLSIRDMRHEESSARAAVKDKSRVLEAFALAIVASRNTILTKEAEIQEVDIPMEDMEPERPDTPPAKKKELKKESSVRRGSSMLGTTGVIIGAPIAIGGAALAAGGRFFKTFFNNIYKLTMDPGKFFSELSSKYSSAMQEPPKGKGGVMGFLSGTKWLLVGDPPPKKEKTK